MKKLSRLRRIDQGTVYDIVGKMKWLARQIEHGDLGEVRNVVIAVHAVGSEVAAYHYGTADIPTAAYIFESAKRKIVG